MLEKKTQKNKCQLISAKTLQKCLRREEPVFLAFVRPTQNQQEQGMTQRVKREQMKLKGPVRKAPRSQKLGSAFAQKRPREYKKTTSAIGGVHGLVS